MNLITWSATALGAAAAAASATFGVAVGSADYNPALPGVYVAPSAHFEGDGGRVATITEDSPEWNCATMGDHRCGPGVVPPLDTDTTVCYPEWDGTAWVWKSEYTADGLCAAA